MNNNLFIVAKYSYSYITFSALAFVIFYIFGFEFFSTIAFFVTLYFIAIFRNPERELQQFEASSIIAPCDGVVSSIEELEDDEYRYKIEIDSSITDVGILRAPINANVASCVLTKGAKLSKNSKLFNDLSESLSIEFIDEKQNSVKVIHRSKQSLVPIFSDLKESQEVVKSIRYGFATNSVTTLYLKSNVRVNLQLAQQVRAAESLIANFS